MLYKVECIFICKNISKYFNNFVLYYIDFFFFDQGRWIKRKCLGIKGKKIFMVKNGNVRCNCKIYNFLYQY